MSDSPAIPEWDLLDVPVDDDAEPDDAEVEVGYSPETADE